MASGNELLRALGGIASVNAPNGAAAPAQNARAGQSTAGIDFQAMLERARAGNLESGLPVRIANGATAEVSDEQLARLGPVIDRLHASGASHALVAIDGRFLKVDVVTREVRGEFDPASGGMLEGIDAVASAPARDGAASPLIGVPGFGVLSPSLARALERDEAA